MPTWGSSSSQRLSPPPATVVQVLLVVYPFLWLQLYLFLFKQRAKKLGPASRGAKKE